jgi:retron-type reverse transcriptase
MANDAPDKVRPLQRRLYRAAKRSRARRFHALFDKVHRRDILERAWSEVAAHGGAAGVDGQTIDEIRRGGVPEFIARLQAELREGTYRPLAVRRVAIPKATGGERVLGVPAVRDRVVQAAVKLVIEPVFEADFLDCSWGFRPRRSARQARERMRTHIQRERRHVVVDADIKGFFDNLDRGVLKRALQERVSDRRVLALIDRWLAAGVLADGELLHPSAGTPQGGVISPLLANVYLHALDRAWQERHGRLGQLTRYADDRVPRTLKEDRCRRRLRRMRCRTGDGGWPSAVALQGEAANHRELLRSRAGVVSVAEKARRERVRCGSRRRAQAIPPLRRRKRIDGIETGVELLPRDEPGGGLLTGQAVPGVKVARAWSGLSCGTGEPVAPRPRAASGGRLGPRPVVEARTPSSGNCEGESSDAGHRGGPTRSSDEGPVMGLERRGRVVLAGSAVNRLRVGGAG